MSGLLVLSKQASDTAVECCESNIHVLQGAAAVLQGTAAVLQGTVARDFVDLKQKLAQGSGGTHL